MKKEFTVQLRRFFSRELDRRQGRILLVSLPVVVFIALMVHLNPIKIEVGESLQDDLEPEVAHGFRDVMLLTLPGESPVEASRYEDVDSTLQWSNLLIQEFGGYLDMPLDAWDTNLLQDVALLVVPYAVSGQIAQDKVAVIESYVRGGGRLLVEVPGTAWSSLSGFSVNFEDMVDTRRITAFDGAPISGALRDDVLGMSINSSLAPVSIQDITGSDSSVLLEVDGLSALTWRALGEGEVFSLLFNLGQALTHLQQGVPGDDWQLAQPTSALPEGFSRTAVLLSDPGYREGIAPVADLLEQNIARIVTQRRPVPRVWRFPGVYSGAFVMTHTGVPELDRGSYMGRWEQENGFPSSPFIRCDGAESEAFDIAGSAGLLIVPPEVMGSPSQDLGLLGFEPFFRTMNYAQQVEAFRARWLEEGQPVISRVIDGLWELEFGESFQILASAGVDVDTTYGPAFRPTSIESEVGYSFGTGLPFRPLDRKGRLIDIWEIPVVVHDGAALDHGLAEQIIEDAGRKYNQLILADWRAGTMVSAPEEDVVTTWMDSFQWAQASGLWLTSMPEFMRFWDSRLAVEMHSEWLPSQRRLVVEVTGHQGEESAGLSVAVESQFEGRSMGRILRNSRDVPFDETGESADGTLRIIPLHASQTRLEITYQGPIQFEPFQ